MFECVCVCMCVCVCVLCVCVCVCTLCVCVCVCVCMTELLHFAVFVVFVTQELPKKTHLCLSGYDEPFFALNCSTELQLLASPSYVQPSDGAGS